MWAPLLESHSALKVLQTNTIPSQEAKSLPRCIFYAGGFKLHGCPGFRVRPSTYPVSPFTPPNRDVWVDRSPTGSKAPAISVVGLYGIARATVEWLHSSWQLFPGRCTWIMDLNSCFQGRPTGSSDAIRGSLMSRWLTMVLQVHAVSWWASHSCNTGAKNGFGDGEWRQVWNFCLGANRLLEMGCSYISGF